MAIESITPRHSRGHRSWGVHAVAFVFLASLITPLTLSLLATTSSATSTATTDAGDVTGNPSEGDAGTVAPRSTDGQRRTEDRSSVSRSAERMPASSAAEVSPPEEVAPQEVPPQEVPPQEVAPQEAAAQESPAHEDARSAPEGPDRADRPALSEETVDIAAQAERDRQRAPESGVIPAAGPALLATTGTVDVLVPAADDAEAVIGFHEATSGRAHVMNPLGTTIDSDNPNFDPVDERAGHDHVVLASRGRGTAPTSAADIALAKGTEVLAPVSGVVTTAAEYALYGQYRDDMIVIASDQDPTVLVHLLHVQDLLVKEGQRVRAGVTPVATVRVLPFGSQIDRITKDARPHVHLELRPQ